MSSGSSRRPPFPCGLAPIRRSPVGRERPELIDERTLLVELHLGLVAAQPILEHREVVGVLAHAGEGHLVGAERPLDLDAVDDIGAGPALRRAQHDRGPPGSRREAAAAGVFLDLADARVSTSRGRRRTRDASAPDRSLARARGRIRAREEAGNILVARATENGRPADLELVEMQDRQHRSVARRVQEPHALPRALERPGLRFAVADDARDDEIGVVERRAERVHQRVAELAAFMDRSGRGHAHMARNAARRRELPEQAQHAVLVLGDVGVDLGVRAFQVHVGDQRGTAVTRARDVDDVRVRARG